LTADAEDQTDIFKTIAIPVEGILYKDRKSKFYGYAFPIVSEHEVKPILNSLKAKYHTANHVCYAWQLGTNTIRYRANDDGEPNNSAGMPIYGQLKSFEVTNILVAVVRIFGGTKLGVGGLISAYRTTAQLTLHQAKIVQRTILVQLQISFGYAQMNEVMQKIKVSKAEIIKQDLNMDCVLVIGIRKKEAALLVQNFSRTNGVIIKEL